MAKLSDEVPFGARALEQGLEVEGIWISRPSTPLTSENMEPRISLGSAPKPGPQENSHDMQNDLSSPHDQEQDISRSDLENMHRGPEPGARSYSPRRNRNLNGKSTEPVPFSPCVSARNDRSLSSRHNRWASREISLPTVSSIKEETTSDCDTTVKGQKSLSSDHQEQESEAHSLSSMMSGKVEDDVQPA